MKPQITTAIKPTKQAGRKPRWIQRKCIGIPMSSAVAEYFMVESRADGDYYNVYAEALAGWILDHPDLAGRLRPEGKFHRKILACLQSHPKMTPELRGRLATYPHICPYLI
jgi:hypothetical protein